MCEVGNFGEGVRLIRRARGMTQAQLAARVRIRRKPVTPSYISRVEHGLLNPRLSTICAIAKALRVRPWNILAFPEHADWWQTYLSLSPIGKREVQRVIRWYANKT